MTDKLSQRPLVWGALFVLLSPVLGEYNQYYSKHHCIFVNSSIGSCICLQRECYIKRFAQF